MADRRTPTVNVEADEDTITDLALMVKRLSVALKKADPSHDLPDKAIKLLASKGIKVSDALRR